MASRIEFHPKARTEFRDIDRTAQLRIKKALDELARIDDPRQRLIPYSATLKGFWKLRCGDYRLVCEILQHGGQTVLIIHLAHRSRVYSKSGMRTIRARTDRD